MGGRWEGGGGIGEGLMYVEHRYVMILAFSLESGKGGGAGGRI